MTRFWIDNLLDARQVTGEGDDKYLIATAEQPLCAYHQDDWIHPSQLPAGYNNCLRTNIFNGQNDHVCCRLNLFLVFPDMQGARLVSVKRLVHMVVIL